VWLAPALRIGSVVEYLRFHTGAPLTSDVKAARFLICDPVSAADAMPEADIGSAEYPDRSATIVLQVSTFATGLPVLLSGPGIEAEQEFRAAGLDGPFWEAVQDNHRLFPLGRDFVFASPDRIAALPRSTDVAMVVQG
jgi:alpha-D-ribose 1-methylphosphonate 5-triphosphate synthase subunit PhnH